MRSFFIVCFTFLIRLTLFAQEKDSVIIWKPSKLSWNDFKGLPESNYSNAKAKSRLQLKFEIHDSCTCAPKKFTIEVAAVFYPSESWIRNKLDSNSKVLEHEQVHFDIVEVLARRLRRDLTTKMFSNTKFRKQIEKLRRKAFRDFFDLNKQYDSESRGGLDLARQEKWRAIIAAEMGELSAYLANEIRIQFEPLK